jgi:hypothetical protein
MDTQTLHRVCMIGSALCGMALSIPSFANDSSNNSSRSNSDLEGTWVAKVTGPAPTPFLSLQSYAAGGLHIEENSSATDRTVAQGEWTKVGPREYVSTRSNFNFDASRTFTGITKVTSHIILNPDGDEFDTTAIFETYDAAGHLVRTGDAASHARRCTFSTPVPHCLGF